VTVEESLKDVVEGYYGSKKLAEKAAWDFIESKKPHFSLTTVCPPYVGDLRFFR
jgi:NADPH-dependent methylglyoxal reductase